MTDVPLIVGRLPSLKEPHYGVVIRVPCEVRELYMLIPRMRHQHIFSRILESKPPEPNWRGAPCILEINITAEFAEKIRAVYGSVRSGVRALVAEVVKRFQQYLDKLKELYADKNCVEVMDVARRLASAFGSSSEYTIRNSALRILHYLGFTEYYTVGRYAYMCRPDKPFTISMGSAEDLEGAVKAVIEELASSCLSWSCKARIVGIAKRLGIAPTTHNLRVIRSVVEKLGYEVECISHKCYVVIRR
jgi:hypothetical protein